VGRDEEEGKEMELGGGRGMRGVFKERYQQRPKRKTVLSTTSADVRNVHSSFMARWRRGMFHFLP